MAKVYTPRLENELVKDDLLLLLLRHVLIMKDHRIYIVMEHANLQGYTGEHRVSCSDTNLSGNIIADTLASSHSRLDRNRLIS